MSKIKEHYHDQMESNMRLQLGAYLDQNGNAFVGQIGNTEWLHYDLPSQYTRVLNEKGGEVVTFEDIARAYFEHQPAGTSIFFDSEDTQAFFHEAARDHL